MKAVSLISGGIDSPVATYLMMRKGVDVIAVHFDNRPFTDERHVNKALRLVEHLEKVLSKKIKTYIVPHGKAQTEFARHCRHNLQCVLCRRMMLRVAKAIADLEKSSAIITGESLGQVASQTLRNIRVESQAIQFPVLRPLIGFDKVEIIEIARSIDTYEISIMPGICCTIVPKRPMTYASLSQVVSEENKVDIASLLNEALKGAVIK